MQDPDHPADCPITGPCHHLSSLGGVTAADFHGPRCRDTMPTTDDAIPSEATLTLKPATIPRVSGHVYLRLQRRPQFNQPKGVASCCAMPQFVNQIREMVRYPAVRLRT